MLSSISSCTPCSQFLSQISNWLVTCLPFIALPQLTSFMLPCLCKLFLNSSINFLPLSSLSQISYWTFEPSTLMLYFFVKNSQNKKLLFLTFASTFFLFHIMSGSSTMLCSIIARKLSSANRPSSKDCSMPFTFSLAPKSPTLVLISLIQPFISILTSHGNITQPCTICPPTLKQ